MTRFQLTLVVASLVLTAGASGCGSSSSSTKTTTASAMTTAGSVTTTQSHAGTTTVAAPAASALTAEAQSAAAGDISDNQVFLVFHNPVGYAIKYPEGWLQHGTRQTVTFEDKNNRLRIVIGRGPAFSTASVRTDLATLKAANTSFAASSPTQITLPGGAAFKVTYSTESAPSPVTNKRVTLAVDRYYLSKGGRRAIIDLGAPKGVDNVDAFRLISQSFRWR